MKTSYSSKQELTCVGEWRWKEIERERREKGRCSVAGRVVALPPTTD